MTISYTAIKYQVWCINHQYEDELEGTFERYEDAIAYAHELGEHASIREV